MLRTSAKIPFDSEVRVANPTGSFHAGGAEDGEIRGVNVQFQVMGQPIVQLVIRGVLPKVWELRVLKSIVLVKKLEVQLSFWRYGRVVGVEGQLSLRGFGC